MFGTISRLYKSIDIVFVFAMVAISLAGLFTMSSFQGNDSYFWKQGLWIMLSLSVFFFSLLFEYRFLKQTRVVMVIYVLLLFILSLLFVLGHVAKGAGSWFQLFGFAFQPSDLMKLGLIIVLAKYFSRRHIEIANIRHIVVSFIYMLIPFALVVLQPDFGSAMVLFAIWLGLVFVSGISVKHLLFVFLVGIIIFSIAWKLVFKPYQKARIINFINPLQDIRGTGYNAYQSTIAVGSGGVFGKGIGYGTQSRLNFLPEYKTDFIFAAFSEEWGLFGVVMLFVLFSMVIWRLLYHANNGATNFEKLFASGVAILFVAHSGSWVLYGLF